MLTALFHGSLIAFATLFMLETSSEEFSVDSNGSILYGEQEGDVNERMIYKQLGQKD